MSLGAAYKDSMIRAFQSAIDVLGVPGVFTQTKAPNWSGNVTVGFAPVGKDDTEIVNAFGINARIITMSELDFDTEHPAKFDQVLIGDETFTLDEVQKRYVNDVLVGWKAIVRGK